MLTDANKATLRFSRAVSNVALAVLLGNGGCARNPRPPECAVLVPAMTELGERLAAARGVLTEPDVAPAMVAEVLRPFSNAAKKTANTLTTRVPSNARLHEITAQASAAADRLGAGAAQMAEYADQMSDVDAANKAVDEDKQRVDKLEAQIRQLCEADTTKCVAISGILARFPAPSDQNGVDQDIAVWTRKLTFWTNDLAKVHITDDELRGRVEAFKKGWQELATAMSRVAAILEIAKKYEELNHDFNAQIERANEAIAATNSACHEK